MYTHRRVAIPATLSSVAFLAGYVLTAHAQVKTDAIPQPPVRKTAQFMLLPYETKDQIETRTGANSRGYWKSWADYGQKLKEAGVLAGGNALQAPSEARTIRGKGGKVIVQNGSYARSPEQISGYMTLQVENMEEAVRWAKQCPAVANGGAVEVRPSIPVMATDMMSQ